MVKVRMTTGKGEIPFRKQAIWAEAEGGERVKGEKGRKKRVKEEISEEEKNSKRNRLKNARIRKMKL